ncbi:MAG: SMP-30/gluconolactonase/LRE family protein [Pseudomonadota bacterium]
MAETPTMPNCGPVTTYDDRACGLGEGPLWHPGRAQLFWFDITGNCLRSRTDAGPMEWHFEENVSAAGWIDDNTLLIASASAFLRFDIETGRSDQICLLEADNPVTRSNDGRVDPWGGFWIGTMGRKAERNAGAIYRYYRGEVRQLYAPISIPNAICFAPDGSSACFTDTAQGMIWRQKLDEAHGWPVGEPEPFIDCRAARLAPDGAVIDSAGRLWNAQWGASRVAVYDRDGALAGAIATDAPNTTCPAFGGPGLSTLFITSATRTQTRDSAEGSHGHVFVAEINVEGQAEHQVIL